MISVRRKLANKRKIITPKGANRKSKRKVIWTMEDIPSLNIPSIEQAEIYKPVDLSTPPHLLLSSTYTPKCIDEQHEQLIETTDETTNIEEDEICDEVVNNANQRMKLITAKHVVDPCVNNDEHEDDDEIQMSKYHSPRSPTVTFQAEKENFNSFAIGLQTNIGEKENQKIQRVETLREKTFGEEIMILNVDILNSPMLSPESNRRRYEDIESNITISSVSEYDNDNQSNSHEQIYHGSIEEIGNTEIAEAAQKINIMDLINSGNAMWEEVIQRYKEVGKMSKKHRKAIMEAIIQYALVKNIFIDHVSMLDIYSQISKIFPTEIPAAYFVKIGKKPYGKFYNLYHRKRGEYQKDQREREIPETLLEPPASIALFENDGEGDNVYIQKWKETFAYRQKKVLKYDSFDDYISEWPIIGKPLGPLLINIDFKTVYGKRLLTSNNWNLFFSNNWAHITKNINREGARFCRKVHKLKESPQKDAALSMVLHYLLRPAYGGFKWKPSYVDSQNTFLKFIKDESMEDEIEQRNKVCQTRGIKWHPYIIGQGPSKRKIKHFYVVIHNTQIKVANFLSGLDLCMKLFILLRIPYPPESRAVWIVVNKLFYNINVDDLMTARYLEFLNEIK